MTLKDKIKLAFEHRTMPQTLATPGAGSAEKTGVI
jgi:hypothetical protein